MENSRRAIALMACLAPAAIIATSNDVAPVQAPAAKTEKSAMDKFFTPVASLVVIGTSWFFAHWATQLLGVALAGYSAFYTYGLKTEDAQKNQESFIAKLFGTKQEEVESFNFYYKIYLAAFAVATIASLVISLGFPQYRTIGMISKIASYVMTLGVIAVRPESSDAEVTGALVAGLMSVPMATFGLPAALVA
jgi:ABC-type transport system involved in cytochrome bd biosynthesis fused ATPase/permease subunit